MVRMAWAPYRLFFRFEARTSRAVMMYKDTYFIKMWHDDAPELAGIGEVPLFKGLSAEDTPDFERVLTEVCRNGVSADPGYSSIKFGLYCARHALHEGGKQLIFASDFAMGKPIEINGLVWMGDKRLMAERVRAKLNQGFRCIKLKVGGIDFEDEFDLISSLRARFPVSDLEIRLDANGAFNAENALERLNRLSALGIHSIEQPVKPRQPQLMAELCRQSPIPIALDEELIGISLNEAQAMLDFVRPAYIILKPALCGGFQQADQLIGMAHKLDIGWWATSALESNVGLNAIAQWVSGYDPTMPQGLGTGALYTNNIASPLHMVGSTLTCDPNGRWEWPQMNWRE